MLHFHRGDHRLPFTLSLLASSLGVAALSPASVSAQDIPSLSPVTVTAPAVPAAQRAGSLATGVGGSTLDTPFSVTDVSAALVREQAGTTLQDALRNVPGAQADSGFNGAHTQFFILRGAGVDSGTGSTECCTTAFACRTIHSCLPALSAWRCCAARALHWACAVNREERSIWSRASHSWPTSAACRYARAATALARPRSISIACCRPNRNLPCGSRPRVRRSASGVM